VAFIAATVKMDELSEEMETGLAVMLTVGGGFAVTVTAVLADVFPPAPSAVAV
jgi:hypothetical protein